MDLDALVNLNHPVTRKLITAAAVNYAIPLFSVALAGLGTSVLQPKGRVEPGAVERHVNLPMNYGVLEYLNLASSIVYNQANMSGGVCRDFARQTYEVFRTLIRQNSRNDLVDEVRMAMSGFTKTDRRELIGHCFLEYKLPTGAVMGFEPTDSTPLLNPHDAAAVIMHSQETQLKKAGINGEADKYVHARTRWGGRLLFPTLRAITELKGGALELYYKAIRDDGLRSAADHSWANYHARNSRIRD